MAMSFARPDPSSPASVADAGFGTTRRGFDQDEVRDFLRMVAAELGRLQERERYLERELRTVQSNPDLDSVQLDDQTLTRLLGEETTRVLTTARESAAEIRGKAEQSVAQMLSEAGDEAARLREEAEVEASRRRADAGADAEAELAMAKQQGREMVNEARAYRERVLSELARRRELAREQIEQLLHGRDRLMRSFEQARVVAVDVVAELQPLGEPDEYVNLAPTTGPVPVMVPNSPRPGASDQVEAAPPTPIESTIDESTRDGGSSGAEVVELIDSHGGSDEADTESEEIQDAEQTESSDVDQAADGAERSGNDIDGEAGNEGDELWADDAAGATEAIDHGAIDDGTSDDSDDSEDDVRDDVVVDLFARLRADAGPEDDESSAVDDEPNEEAAVSVVEVEAGVADAEAEEPDPDDEAEPTPFEQRDADLTPLIVASAKKLKRVLADEQNEVLDALRKSESVADIDDLIPQADDHIARYTEAIADELLAAANAGAASVATGRAAKLRKADASRTTAAAGAVLGEWLVTPLRERLERCVADGDGDNTEIVKRVRTVYRECKTQHIDEQLDDVVRAAHGRGVLAAFEPGSVVVWAADGEHAVCADCDDNTLAGPVVVGEKFPTGHVFAPAHIGCRCLLMPAGS
jgi:DivIVA domain-containing protein